MPPRAGGERHRVGGRLHLAFFLAVVPGWMLASRRKKAQHRHKPQRCRHGRAGSGGARDRQLLARLADQALATGEAVFGRWRSSDVAVIPDVARASTEPVLGPLPPTPRLYRADGRYVDIFRVPGPGDER